MKNIREQIKSGNFKHLYLLYGAEDYLRSSYKNMLKKALLADGDEMNYSYYEGAPTWINELTATADTLPFFSERRVLLVENSGLFKAANDLPDYLSGMPDTTYIIFSETDVDKRSRMYKAVKEAGYVCEFTSPTPAELKAFIAGRLSKDGKRMTETDGDYMLQYCGTDLFNLKNELEKLVSYCHDRDIITRQDIDAVCTIQVSSHIFDMIDSIGKKQIGHALTLYYDLLTLREKPMTILYLITKHFNRLLQISDLRQLHKSDVELAAAVGIPVWSLKNYNSQLKNFSYSMLRDAVNYGTELEEAVKLGNIDDQIAVEIMIVKFK